MEKEDVGLDLEDDVEEEKVSKNDDFKLRMFKFMIAIVIIVILLLFILYIFSSRSPKKEYSYSEVEAIMKKAAISYFAENPENLPLEEGNIVEIDASNLIALQKMKDFSEYRADGNTCTGSVQVEKTGVDYLYTPYLNCGDSYVTIELHKKVLSDNSVVTSGYGLYSINGGYAFRGETVNNYVQLGDYLWRIVKITANNNVVLVSADGLPYIKPWDNRYNEQKSYESGINQYGASRIKEYVEELYINPSEKDWEKVFSEKDKGNFVSYNLCIGKRAFNSESKDNSEECSQVLKDQKVGLLTLSDYLYASIDPNCKSPTTKSCKNYNYLVIKNDWWLVTASKSDSSSVFLVSRGGTIKEETANNYAVVRPVVYLNSNVLYKKGKGTLKNPYTIR